MVSVLNWAKYNPRADVGRHSWFRLDHDFPFSSQFFDLDCGTKWLWIVVLCLAAKNQGKPFKWNCAYIKAHTGLNPEQQDTCLDKLVNIECIALTWVSDANSELSMAQCEELTNDIDGVRGRNVAVTPPLRPRTYPLATNERTNETNVTNETDGGTRKRSIETFPIAIVGYELLGDIFLERKVSRKVQETWATTFPDPQWVIEKVRQALAWEASNPTRQKKNFAAFMTRWLTKDWDRRKTQSDRRLTASEVNLQSLGELWRKAKAEEDQREES